MYRDSGEGAIEINLKIISILLKLYSVSNDEEFFKNIGLSLIVIKRLIEEYYTENPNVNSDLNEEIRGMITQISSSINSNSYLFSLRIEIIGLLRKSEDRKTDEG